MHARPCFYCMVLLSTMYLSLCYWPPVSTDTPLAQPWAQNITTFADAIRIGCPTCRQKSGAFSPVNLTKWEEASVNRLVENLERVIAAEKEADRKRQCEVVEGEAKANGTSCDNDLQSSASQTTPLWPWAEKRSQGVVTPLDAHPSQTSVRLPWLRREYDLRRFGFAMVLDFGWSSSHS
ncbi:hypothetical protein BC628DRAFT_104341 [Trametes gibbosa]|nr:hypothetical protein BC628DRAFT_104341 [Trametes gibbosa]